MSEPLKSVKFRKRVLIVDDDEDVRDFLVSLFQEIDCEVDTAVNGGFAENLIHKNRYRLIVTDLQMEVIGGVALVSRIRKCPKNRKTPIIVLSGFIDKTIVQELVRLGETNIFTKPVDPEKIISKAKELMEKNASL